MTHSLKTLLALACTFSTTLLADSPNIIVINVDDLGWADVNYMPDQKHRFYTPNITKLASQGMVFTNAYSACPVCSPTRASLVTGKSTAALKLTAHIPGNPPHVAKKTPAGARFLPAQSRKFLPLEEVTFAEVLKNHGYRTGFIGKWHLAGEGSSINRSSQGSIAPEYHPDKQGFDTNIGGCAYGQPGGNYFDPHNNATIKDRKEGEYLTDRLGDEAAHFIKQNKDHKFLLYLNPYSVHSPIQAPKERVELMKKKLGGNKNTKYAAMVYSMDLMIGKVTQQLDQLGLTDSTLLVFTSDNGGQFGNAPLRDKKGTLYEGGIRVPQIIRWPGVIAPGSVSHEPVISYDIFPTLLAAAGCMKDCPTGVEGHDLSPLFNEKSQANFKREAPLLWHYPHYHHGGANSLDMGSAMRDGDWKFVYIYKSGKTFLFNLKEDRAEKNNLIATHPERAKELQEKLFSQLRALDANMPIERE